MLLSVPMSAQSFTQEIIDQGIEGTRLRHDGSHLGKLGMVVHRNPPRKPKMTIQSTLSKLLPIIQRLWGVDTTTPSSRHSSGHGRFGRVATRSAYTRNGIRVTISHGGEWSGENGGSVSRDGE